MNRQVKEQGFTLIELLMAMAVFSFILLFVTTGFIMINRAYSKGITVKLVQDEGRQLVESLTREIRVSGSVNSATPGCLIVNGQRYTWTIAHNGDANAPKKLLKDKVTECATTPVETDADTVSLLHDRVGVQHMEVNSISGGSYQITVVLSTTQADLLDANELAAACGTQEGSQYCDVVTYTTVVSTR